MTGSVLLENVIAYQGDVLALDGVSAGFPAGAVTAITGGNGSGKSTLLAVTAGVLAPTAGQVRRPAGGVALVRQSWSADRTPPLTVRATVGMGRWAGRRWFGRATAADRAAVEDAMERLAVADLAGRSLTALSGGQRQRVLIARGLAQQAPVLLVDEPTAGTDTPARDRILAALQEEADRGAVVVHVTHEPLALTDRVRRLHLDGGRVAVPTPTGHRGSASNAQVPATWSSPRGSTTPPRPAL